MTADPTIRARREALGWTQADLARNSGVSQTQIGYAERGGRQVSADDLRYIRAALRAEEMVRERAL